MDAASLKTRTRAALDATRANVDAFLELPGTTPAREVLAAFDGLCSPLNGGRLHAYVELHPDAELRDAGRELQREVAALSTELSLHRGLFERLSALDAARLATPEERRLLEHALRDFRRSGVDRDEATRERIRALSEELVQIGQEFSKNIVEGDREHVFPGGHADLEGLPADFLAANPEREDGSVVLTSDAAHRLPVLSYARNHAARRAYYRTTMQRAAPENLEVLPRLLAKRHELATLLGYAHWADYVTETKMTGSAAEARRFLERVIELVRDRAVAERDELLEELHRDEPDADGVSEADRGYLVECVKKRRHDFDAQAVRPYFAFENVLRGVLETSARLYGVEFRPREDEEPWHASVRSYDVVDGGEVIARFHLDMHPREGKFKHAAMMHMVEGFVAGGKLPEAAIACNFPEPTADDPALLEHDQVTTFFHEFGHLLHQLFARRVSFMAFAGISTEYDFVEVPSQMYEEWAWDTGVLQRFAKHHETGEPIPADLVARMRAADDYGKALHVTQQMYYAMLALTYYDRSPEGLDVEALSLELKEQIVPLRGEPGNRFVASFGHLDGYSAIYYTYMWSLVIAKDMFSRFEGDLMDGATANDYRGTVLEPGGSRDAAELVKGFLGREYGFEAFERWLAR